MPVTGRLLTHYSSSRIMLLGSLVFGITLGLLGLVNAYWQLILILFCFGSSRNLLNLSMNTQSVLVQRLYQKSIINTFHGIWSLSGFAGAALGYLMIAANIATLWHLVTVSITTVLLSLIYYPRTLHETPDAHATGKPVFSWPDKALLKFALICFTSMACENIMYDWGEIYLHDAVHTSKATATAGFVVFMIAVTTGRFAGDTLVNRKGIKFLLKFCSLFVVAGFLCTIAFPDTIIVMVGYALVGLGVSCVVPLVFSQAGKSASMSSGTAIAAVSTVGYLGFLMVPPVVGFLAQAASLRWAFTFITLLGFLMAALVASIQPEN